MRRDDYIEILRQHPYYSKKFNNSKELIKFPSSFGICYDQNKMWVFYEVDERQEVTKNFFNNEADAFEFAFKKYGLNSSLMFYHHASSTMRYALSVPSHIAQKVT